MRARLTLRPLLLTALCAALLAGCANNKEVQKLFNNLPDSNAKQMLQGAAEATSDVSPEEERAMGKDMSALLLGAKPLLRHPAAEQYVNRLGLWIALQSERPELPWRFGIINDNGINAFAAPGGYVFVTKGLLLSVKSESELAGVLGHEIAHVIKRHHVQVAKKKGMGKLVSGVIGQYAQKEGAPELAAMNNLFKNVYTSGLDQADEYEADELGVVLATRAGYSPYGLPSVLQMFAAANAKTPGFELLFSTHPMPNDRLNRLDKLMGDKLDGFEKTASQDSSRLRNIQRLLAR